MCIEQSDRIVMHLNRLRIGFESMLRVNWELCAVDRSSIPRSVNYGTL